MRGDPITPADARAMPAPPGPFQIVMRLYWPKPEALDGTWQPPKLVKVS